MKVKILNSSGWYKKNVGEEFEIEENTEYYDKYSNVRFKSKNNGWIYDKDCVITELHGDFCVKRCDDKEKWNKYVNWLKKKYYRVITDSGEYTYYGRKNTMDSIGSSISFGIEIHIDDIIKHIDFYSEPMVLESEEEFDLTTNEGRLAYAKKHYPIGTKYIPISNNGELVYRYSREIAESTYNPIWFTPSDNCKGIICGNGFIYGNGKWAEIINEVKEEKMETNILELIRLFPELPTDYAKKLVQKALEVKNGCLNDLANFIGSVSTPTPFYEIITGSKSEQKADYVWRKIYDFKNKKMETQKLSRKGLKEIHSVACGNWKAILEGYSIRNSFEDYIELTQGEVDNMFNACTKEQLQIVSKYLIQDDGSVDVTDLQVDGNGFLYGNYYVIRDREQGEYRRKSFLLSQQYKWEIKKDELGQLCLIPTKKK